MKNGNVVSVYDKNGNTGVELKTSDLGNDVIVYGKQEKVAVGLGTGEDDTGVYIYGQAGTIDGWLKCF